MTEHLLVRLGKKRFETHTDALVHFVDEHEANAFLNNLTQMPHAYVLACCMDRQTKAERAWSIPYRINEILGGFTIELLSSISCAEYKDIFKRESLHRFNEIMADIWYEAVQKIAIEYHGDASEIWANNPSSAAVVYRFLRFKGVGIKIATMATNILARQFKVPFSDYYSIDVSPDTHVKRVMYRLGLVEEDASNDDLIYKAREMNPEFPGIIDYSLWEIGREYCRPQNPKCEQCSVKSVCCFIN